MQFRAADRDDLAILTGAPNRQFRRVLAVRDISGVVTRSSWYVTG